MIYSINSREIITDVVNNPYRVCKLWNGILFQEISGPCSPSATERRDLEKQLTEKTPYCISPIQYKKGLPYHVMTNSGGKSILEKPSVLEDDDP